MRQDAGHGEALEKERHWSMESAENTERGTKMRKHQDKSETRELGDGADRRQKPRDANAGSVLPTTS
mgnify:CR=1 FL=1